MSLDVHIEQVTIAQAPLVFDWVTRLLVELGDEAEDLGTLDEGKALEDWRQMGDRFRVFVARDPAGDILGVLTLTETFAIYANGNYGVIDEMYVAPAMRGSGIGARLLDAVKVYGRGRGWTRIDVTAPEDPRWDRSRRFYESQGFVFTGPKLKFVLEPPRTHP